ncbi:MAG: glutamate formimidoyltransferase [Candidatus Thermoplasmatota archaeon]|nr:glutamate formimidoyltransferase [Candidatus Thermoplasmatota archaeon]
MMDRIVECVPNFSEGRDRAVLEAISGGIKSVDGVKLLNVDPGADFNRTVFTFVGEPDDVLEAAFQAARIGTALIDMRKHKGEHARMGALDVCPFIPIKNVTMEECNDLAHRFGTRMWDELGIPVFLYANSARTPERISLPGIRKGEYEALEEKFKDNGFRPDFGKPVFVPRSGATATGSRQVLIAYNVNLNTSDKTVASEISGRIRESGVLKKDEKGEKVIGPDGKSERIPGRFKGIQAGGMMYNEDIAQVSMNLLDFNEVNLHDVYEACREEAHSLGVEVSGSEIVGLVPLEALLKAGRFYSSKLGRGLSDDIELVEMAISELGLNQLYEFRTEEKVIEYMVTESNPLANLTVKDFLRVLASDSPTPGGGSVAALSGALGAALMEMVCRLTIGKKRYEDVWEEMKTSAKDISMLKKRLLELVDEDTHAFNDVMSAFKLPKETEEEKAARSRAIQTGYKKAISTPIETAEVCLKVLEMGVPVAGKGNMNSISDVGVGAEMTSAGLDGAVMNVRINLSSIKDEDYVADIEERIVTIMARKEELLASIRSIIKKDL